MALISSQLPYSPDSLDRYARLRPLGCGLLLDSGSGYPDHLDILTAAPVQQVRMDAAGDNLAACMHTVRTWLKRYPVPLSNHPAPGWYGVWSYNLGVVTESVRVKPGALPLLWMGFYPAVIVVDHQQQQTCLYALPGYEGNGRALAAAFLQAADAAPAFHLQSDFTGNLPEAEYNHCFGQVQEHIHAGNCYQINLTREFQARYSGSPWCAYQQLRRELSAPMGCYLEVDDWALLSLSPERFIRAIGNQVETKPIKGTRPRHLDAARDEAQRQALQNSVKDRAENLMIVDLLRNDLGRTCEVGSVAVQKLFAVESFSNVHHMVSTVAGTLAQGMDPLDLLLGAFPGGSITGAPKHHAMEIIDQLEPHSREFYCGSVLYLDVCGRMDSNILIRSLVAQNGSIRCWGGGGVVADSTAPAEYQEIQDKIGNILKILQ